MKKRRSIWDGKVVRRSFRSDWSTNCSMLDYSQICFSFSQCKHVRKTFDGILLSTPLLIIIYKGKQGAEAYLRVSPKQEIKMTVTHPFKVKKIYILKTPGVSTSPPGFIKLHFMDDFVWFLPQCRHTEYNIYQGWCSWEKKHTNCDLFAHLCSLNDKLQNERMKELRPTCNSKSTVLFPLHWSDSKGSEWRDCKIGLLCLCKKT